MNENEIPDPQITSQKRLHKPEQTPALPVPRPANDATRAKQIPFRFDGAGGLVD